MHLYGNNKRSLHGSKFPVPLNRKTFFGAARPDIKVKSSPPARIGLPRHKSLNLGPSPVHIKAKSSSCSRPTEFLQIDINKFLWKFLQSHIFTKTEFLDFLSCLYSAFKKMRNGLHRTGISVPKITPLLRFISASANINYIYFFNETPFVCKYLNYH